MDPGVTIIIAICGIATLLTRVGVALYATGTVRAKNSAGTVFQTLCDLCISTLAFWAVGAAILLQISSSHRWLWINPAFLFGPRSEHSIQGTPLLFFYLTMVLTATATVGGAVAERCRLLPLCVASVIMAGFVLPTASYWAWSGWLQQHGFVDVGGGCSLHVAAGVFALVACAFTGARTGKFNRDGSSSMIPGHNLPLAGIGVMLVLVGWIPYMAGANLLRVLGSPLQYFAIGAAGVNVILAASSACVVSFAFSRLRFGKPDILLSLVAILGALVSSCAGGIALQPWEAAAVGAGAGLIVPLAVVFIDLRVRLDDPLGMIAVHLVGGTWGTLAIGVFRTPVPPLTRLQQFGIQVVGIVLIAAFSGVVALLLFGCLKATIGLRVNEADEFDGLDLAEHDIGAYPDFQQNSIKSYHLREA